VGGLGRGNPVSLLDNAASRSASTCDRFSEH
jgi:hypothetical protein